MSKVFVYGSLLSGFSNNRLLEGAEYIGPAMTEPKYCMISLGGFPGVLEEGETAIIGEVYEVDEDIEFDLDCLEGVCHERPEDGMYRRHQDTLTNGQEVTLYVYNGGREGPIVESGNWREYCTENRSWYKRI